MVVALVVCALVIVALVVAHVRLRARTAELTRSLADARDDRDRAGADASWATAQANALVRERDDALERVNRARRDAAEVANRLREETSVRTEAERERDTARGELDAARGERDTARAELDAARGELDAARGDLDEVRAELAEAAAAPARAARRPGADASYTEALWALLLRQVRHTWRVSIALGPDDTSPLDATDDVFRTAVEIEVEAAREEGGAAVDLVWGDDATPPAPGPAALALALLRDLIATLGTAAGRTQLTVTPGAEHVEVRVEAVDDRGTPMAVELPASLEVEPGVARIG